MNAARSAPVVAVALLIGIGLAAALAAMQLRSLALPISAHDGHHWRQSFTYGVAWNYAHTTLDVLRPRMFVECETSNIVAMEPPLYPLLSSLLLRVSGDSTVGPRLVSWLSLVAIMVTLFRWLGKDRRDPREAWADRAGLFIALGLSPMVAVDFRSIQPEPLAAGLAIVAAGCFVRYAERKMRRDAIWGVALTTLAILTKPVVLGVVPGLLMFALWGRGHRRRRGLFVGALLGLGLVLYVGWDRWADHLQKSEHNSLLLISIEHKPAEMLAHLRNLGYAREALFHFLPNFAGSWWLVPAFVAGFFRTLVDRRLQRFGVPFAIWLTGYLVELLAFGDRLHSNAYYFILAPAPVVFFCAVGLGALIRVLDSPRERPPLAIYRVGLALAVLLPMGLLFAKRSNWSSTTVEDLGFARNKLVWTSDFGLAILCIGLLIAIAVAHRLRPRRVPAAAGVAILLVVVASSFLAFRDARQYFGYYAGLQKRDGFTRELAALRAAVDKVSSASDRIISNSVEPVYFYYALRNGFPSSTTDTPSTLAAARARGARLYVHLDPLDTGDSPPEIKGNLVARGQWWRVYCLDAAGCSRGR